MEKQEIKQVETIKTNLYKRDGEYIWFGNYPQNKKFSSELEETLNLKADEAGYYVGENDNNRYAKVTSNPYFDCELSRYAAINEKKGDILFYKLEPIKWRILQEKDGKSTNPSRNNIKQQTI